jgi:hypothetical protein
MSQLQQDVRLRVAQRAREQLPLQVVPQVSRVFDLVPFSDSLLWLRD